MADNTLLIEAAILIIDALCTCLSSCIYRSRFLSSGWFVLTEDRLSTGLIHGKFGFWWSAVLLCLLAKLRNWAGGICVACCCSLWFEEWVIVAWILLLLAELWRFILSLSLLSKDRLDRCWCTLLTEYWRFLLLLLLWELVILSLTHESWLDRLLLAKSVVGRGIIVFETLEVEWHFSKSVKILV